MVVCELGPLISHEHRNRVERYVKLGVDESAVWVNMPSPLDAAAPWTA